MIYIEMIYMSQEKYAASPFLLEAPNICNSHRVPDGGD